MITVLVFLITTHFYIFVLDKDGFFAKRKSKTTQKAQKLWDKYSQIKEEYNKNDEDGVNIILKTADFFRESASSNISNTYYKESFLPHLTEAKQNQQSFEECLTQFKEMGKKLQAYQFSLDKWFINASSIILIVTTILFAFCFEKDFLIIRWVFQYIAFNKLDLLVEILSFCSILVVLIEINCFKKAIKKLNEYYNSQQDILEKAGSLFKTLISNSENIKTRKTELKKLSDSNL